MNKKKESKINLSSPEQNGEVLNFIRNELKSKADERIKKSGERFFKESVKIYGWKTSEVKKLCKEIFKKIQGQTKSGIFKICEDLWQSGFMEESFIACELAYSLRKTNQPADFKTFEKWVKYYVSNWAACDTLCNHTIGEFVETYPEFISDLKKWTQSENRWVRRASAVTLIIPAKKGLFLNDIFEIADMLLTDSDDMVQKGYGWMLKSSSQAHLKKVFDYAMKNKKNMPRTALRYCIEKMPEDMKSKCMEK
ncbi:MAG TPA: DNA alkylation repair protein [bacterium]|nr:DNA alkylation repair protein [bacterium]HPN29767.1 DNA alkylation repair protein [bacterium]